MSTLPAHIWDSQFRMLHVAFACATLHLCTLPADDCKSFCPLPFSLFRMKKSRLLMYIADPKKTATKVLFVIFVGLECHMCLKTISLFSHKCLCCFQPPEVSFQPELKNFMSVCISDYSGSPPLPTHLARPHLTGTH